MPADRTTCTHCGQQLARQRCGCWTDPAGPRWCERGHLHRPEGGTQPERCAAPPAVPDAPKQHRDTRATPEGHEAARDSVRRLEQARQTQGGGR